MNDKNELMINLNSNIDIHLAGDYSPEDGWIFPGRVINNYELIYVQKGEMHISEEGRKSIVKAGEYFIIFPNRWHEGFNNSNNLVFDWVHFIPEEYLQYNVQDNLPNNILRIPQHEKIQRKSRMTQFFINLKNDRKSGFIQLTATQQLLKLILSEVVFTELSHDEKSEAFLGNTIMTYISDKAFSSISTSTIAKELGYNPDYIGRVFKKVYKHSITEAISRQRLIRAKYLLKNSVKTIAEIANICGYEDDSYFCRVFRKQMSISPTQFRNKF